MTNTQHSGVFDQSQLRLHPLPRLHSNDADAGTGRVREAAGRAKLRQDVHAERRGGRRAGAHARPEAGAGRQQVSAHARPLAAIACMQDLSAMKSYSVAYRCAFIGFWYVHESTHTLRYCSCRMGTDDCEGGAGRQKK